MDDGVRSPHPGSARPVGPGGRLQLQMQGIDPTYTLGLLASERDRVLRALEADGPARPQPGSLSPTRGPSADRHWSPPPGARPRPTSSRPWPTAPLTWEVVWSTPGSRAPASERSVAAALLAAAGGRGRSGRPGPRRRGRAPTWPRSTTSSSPAPSPRSTCPCSPASATRSTRRSPMSSPTPPTRRPPRAPRPIVDLAITAAARVEAGLARHRGRRRARADRPRRRIAVTPHGVHVARASVAASRSRTTEPTRRRSASAAPRPAVLARAARAVERRAGRAEGSRPAPTSASTAASLDAARRPDRARPAGRGVCAGPAPSSAATETHLSALDPARALARGWSITRTTTGSVVRRSTDVGPRRHARHHPRRRHGHQHRDLRHPTGEDRSDAS